jgi:hypothetical protein
MRSNSGNDSLPKRRRRQKFPKFTLESRQVHTENVYFLDFEGLHTAHGDGAEHRRVCHSMPRMVQRCWRGQGFGSFPCMTAE